MKKIFLIMALWVYSLPTFSETFYAQLCKFNPNWKNYESFTKKEKARKFNSDKEYIQAHLGQVIPILKNRNTQHLEKQIAENRNKLITILEKYREVGRFPLNYYRKERIPVFIDEHGTHCAVGYLMQQSGFENLAQQIATRDNYAWVKDIKVKDLLKWQEASGFTVEELKLIQGAYEFYLPNAFTAPNKYEIPQKPACMLAYFKRNKKSKSIWCLGEGKNGILHGRWIQNYSETLPWIVGFFENGKKTGQWREYYQGTEKLCRTENWRNDQLNGVRRRFDREGRIIEEIIFRNGAAILKTNFDFKDSLKWERTPLDSGLLSTKVYTFGGALLAYGKEQINNPGNLLWFQDIELTTLNSISITSRDVFMEVNPSPMFSPYQPQLHSNPVLVKYKKLGEWVYYREYNPVAKSKMRILQDQISSNYLHFGNEIHESLQLFDPIPFKSALDSIKIEYSNNLLEHLYAYGSNDYKHLYVQYHTVESHTKSPSTFHLSFISVPMAIVVKELGQFNKSNQKTGIWKFFNRKRQLYKTEHFILPAEGLE